MPQKRLMPLIITVIILFISASSLTVYAARTIAENRATSRTVVGALANLTEDMTQNSQVDADAADETEEPKDPAGQMIEESTTVTDTTSSATLTSESGKDENMDGQDEDSNGNDDQDDSKPVETAVQLISLETARAIALDYAGSEAVIVELELDRDDHPPKYEIKLVAASYEYELEIHAITGAIIAMNRELIENEDTEPDDAIEMN